ncbi:MAG: FtsQ-type POTRA domain-containing protein [Candidatus Auribacterota bacterium]|nr:FtsQ-type POTRA domain-containing protein [Candidatus Auribacterota bacterium]
MKWLILSNKVAPRRKLKAKTPRRRKKKSEPAPSQRPARRGIGKSIPTILLLAALVGGVWWYSHHSEIFLIKKIKVANNHSYSRDEIIGMTELETGGNIFALTPDKARERLLRNTDFRDVYVRKLFPNTIRIEVREREPRARVHFGQLYTIDDTGRILGPRKEADGVGLPVIKGLRVRGLDLYPVDKRDSCLALLQQLEEQDIGSLITIDEIRVFTSDLIEMRANEEMEITLERGNYREQLERLKTVLNKMGPDLSRAREVDLRYSRVPVVFED